MYDERHEAKALDRLAADAGIEAGPNRDAALGLPLGPTNIDGEAVMPLVMTGPDSTRTLDNLTKWGVTLFGPCPSNCYEYRSASGLYRWSTLLNSWRKQDNQSCGFGYIEEILDNPPTIPPPDWNPHDGTKPGAHTACRTDAASLSDLQARRDACRVVEQAAHQALLESLTTQEQFTLVRAYNDSIHATRKAELDVHFGLWANGGAA